MLLDYVGFDWRDGEIFSGIMKCDTGMSVAVQAMMRLVPIVKEIIVQQCAANHGLVIEFQMCFARHGNRETCYGRSMLADGSVAVLNEFATFFVASRVQDIRAVI